MDEYQIRVWAIEQAMQVWRESGSRWTSSDVVKWAKTFEEYVKGEGNGD